MSKPGAAHCLLTTTIRVGCHWRVILLALRIVKPDFVTFIHGWALPSGVLQRIAQDGHRACCLLFCPIAELNFSWRRQTLTQWIGITTFPDLNRVRVNLRQPLPRLLLTAAWRVGITGKSTNSFTLKCYCLAVGTDEFLAGQILSFRAGAR